MSTKPNSNNQPRKCFVRPFSSNTNCSSSTNPIQPNWSTVFHEQLPKGDNEKLTKGIIKNARRTGILNMANKSLTTVPEKVYKLNDPDDSEVTLESLCIADDDAWWNQIPITNLDLSSNCLMAISPRIRHLNTITTLTLHDNAITSIPKSIAELENLTRINLCRNKLSCLPDEFFRLKELRYLNLSYNNFSELSADVSDLHMLEALDVSHNNLTTIPCGVGFLVRLVELYASNNKINVLPPDIISMRSLEHFDLMYNDLSALPEGIGALRKLKFLYIKHNHIQDFPDIGGCESLQELHAGGNCITKVPKYLCSKLPHLLYLDLSSNKLQDLPDEISQLHNLTRLDVSNNSLKDLPHCLARLPNLVALQVEGNQIKSIRSDILKRGTTRILQTLRERCTNNCCNMADGLNSPRVQGGYMDDGNNIFPDKYKMRKSRSLSVVMQNLTDVPEDIFKMANEENISIVDFSRNRFTNLPEGLKTLSDNVEELIFAKNHIDVLPDFLTHFSRITTINFSCNYLKTLPAEFGSLHSLRELNLHNNRFEEIPNCVYDLASLEILLLGDNRIQKIDATSEGLSKLKRLATLDLRNNNIDQVPPLLGTLRNITALEITGNPFRLPRHQIMEKGTEAIMSYLRDRIPD